MNKRDELSEKSTSEKEKVYNKDIKDILHLNLFLLSYDRVPHRVNSPERHFTGAAPLTRE